MAVAWDSLAAAVIHARILVPTPKTDSFGNRERFACVAYPLMAAQSSASHHSHYRHILLKSRVTATFGTGDEEEHYTDGPMHAPPEGS